MKTLPVTVVISLVCVFGSLSLAEEAHHGSGLTWHFDGGYPGGDVTYKFNVLMGVKDRWDPASQDTPPLSPGKAIGIAKEFMRNIPLGKGWSMWRMDSVRLLRSADTEGREEGREEWLYVVYFYAANPNGGRSGAPDMSVPVRMDGTIPEPVISKKKS